MIRPLGGPTLRGTVCTAFVCGTKLSRVPHQRLSTTEPRAALVSNRVIHLRSLPAPPPLTPHMIHPIRMSHRGLTSPYVLGVHSGGRAVTDTE
jgi:hypothetical protein